MLSWPGRELRNTTRNFLIMFELSHNFFSFMKPSNFSFIVELLPQSVGEVRPRFDAERIAKAPSEDSKPGHWKFSLLAFGVILMAMPSSVVRAEQNGWQDIRDDFLQGDPALLQFHCDRGEEANKKSLSAFNDPWVKNVQMLRFEAGVAPRQPDGSNLFFSGLSMAMKSRCPGVW